MRPSDESGQYTDTPSTETPYHFAPWDGRRVPVTLLGGYLGSGKTTVINEFLARTDRPIAVLVNDMGAVNVDASLIRRRHGDTIELTDGCICCSLSNGLADAFDQLRQRAEPPDHVVIELSGIADPHRVVPWANSPGFRLDGVVTLVDCDQVLERLDDTITSGYVTTQIVAADLLVLSKVDLCTTEAVLAVKSALTALAPQTPVVDTAHVSQIAGLLEAASRRGRDVTAVPPLQLFDVHVARTVAIPNPITSAALDALLDDLPSGTVRAKGIAQTPAGPKLLIHVVGTRRVITTLPDAEAYPATDLVVITVDP